MGQRQTEISTTDGVLDARVFTPDHGSGPWPAVIMLTDIRGSRAVFEEMASRLASDGFLVLLPNCYYRAGKAPFAMPPGPNTEPAVRAELDRLKATVSVDGVREDIQAALDFLMQLSEVSGPKLGIVGYCMSGSIALRSAADFPDLIAAAASFHGGGLATESSESPHLRATDLRGRLYLGYATNDKSMPVEAIARLEDALNQAGVTFDAETYSAMHGFAVADSPAYDPVAAEQHWDKMLQLFRSTLKN